MLLAERMERHDLALISAGVPLETDADERLEELLMADLHAEDPDQLVMLKALGLR